MAIGLYSKLFCDAFVFLKTCDFSPRFLRMKTKKLKPSGNVTGRKSVCIYNLYSTFPLGSKIFGFHSQEPRGKVTFGRGCVDCLNLIGQYNLHEPR